MYKTLQSCTIHIIFQVLRDHLLGHEINLNKFKSIEIIWSVPSDSKGTKLEMHNKSIFKYMEIQHHTST